MACRQATTETIYIGVTGFIRIIIRCVILKINNNNIHYAVHHVSQNKEWESCTEIIINGGLAWFPNIKL